MASKPIRVETTRQTGRYRKGAVLGYESEAKAASILGEGTFKIVSYQDGSPYDPPKRSTKSDTKSGEK